MQAAVGVFRECWGVKRPPVKAVQERAKSLGYRYAQLYFIAGNWWLSLAMAACADAVLGISAKVRPQAQCWILVKHGNGPLLIIWQQGRLHRVCQQSLTDCVAECNSADACVEEQQYIQHGWVEPLPEPWADAADVDYDRSQRLVALESLPQLALYRKPRRRWQWLVVLALLLTAAAGGWWMLAPVGTEHSKAQLEAVNAGANGVRQRLPLAAVFAQVEPLAMRRWQGAWQLQSVELKGTHLTTRYHGYAPLALYSMQQTDVINSGANQQQPITRSQVQDISTVQQPSADQLSPWRSDALLRALLTENRPGLKIQRLGSQWQFNWQHWSLPQLRELSQRLAAVPLHLQKLSLIPSEQGWNGNLTLTNPPKVMP